MNASEPSQHGNGRGKRLIRWPSAIRIGVWLVVVGALYFVLHGRGPQVSEGDDPAEPASVPVQYLGADDGAPTTRPTTGPADLTEPMYPQIPLPKLPPELEEYRIQLDDFKLVDGTAGNTEDAYFLMLENVARVPADQAQRVTYAELATNPKSYRGQWVRMKLIYHDHNSQATVRPNRIPKVNVVTALWLRENGEQVAVVVHTRADVSHLNLNDRFEAVGYFYKIQQTGKLHRSGSLDVPVLIAKSVNRVEAGGGTAFNESWALAAAVVVLLVLYLLVRMRMNRPRESAGTYRPRRHEMTDADIERSRRVMPPDELEPGDTEASDDTRPTP